MAPLTGGMKNSTIKLRTSIARHSGRGRHNMPPTPAGRGRGVMRANATPVDTAMLRSLGRVKPLPPLLWMSGKLFLPRSIMHLLLPRIV